MSPTGPKRGAKAVPVSALRHMDTRTNIPTDELRGFIAEDETAPKQALYPRDPSLDPQLVWRGKDEQDQADLAVPTVPIYIQEKVHPRVLIENLRRTAERPEDEPELSLFNDFNGIEFEELVDFYQHEQNWANRLILGDALLVMNSLAEKEGLRGKVQTVYIDPPYGIDFRSNWQATTANPDVKEGKADITRQPEQIRAFRDTWEHGVHSYLAYMRDRLAVTQELLADSGSVFVQISDTNLHRMRCLLDEVFGEENFVSQICFQTTSGFETKTIATLGDYLLWYAKDKNAVKVRKLFEPQGLVLGEGNARWVLLPDGTYRGVSARERRGEVAVPEGATLYQPGDLASQGASGEPQPYDFDGQTFQPKSGSHWKANYPQGMDRLALAGRIHRAKNSLRFRRRHDDFPFQERGNIWTDTRTGNFTDPKVYVVQTNLKVIERCLLLSTDPGDLVLDPTCGSGTTAVAAEKWGRRWITADTSRVAVALTRTRLASARLPYFLLADSRQGHEKEVELSGKSPLETPREDVRKGFVYRRAPHITLESIAKNSELEAAMSNEDLEEAIRRRADQELLLDQPSEDERKVRVCGPFTVESLSPHRILSEEEEPAAESVPASARSYEQTILDNLAKAGVQNQVKSQRLTFENLEPYAGSAWINARGDFTDENGQTRRVGISLGPEYGTVDTEQVREAAKEAVKGMGFDLLLVLGFAFDAHAGGAAAEFRPETNGGWAVTAEERSYGKLPVLLVRMNADLAMGDELLKKTGAGNLFTVFGEPDIQIDRTEGDKVEVEVRGVDVYDPTTGEVRSDSTDEIACWFIDTNYNSESFFVRDAYFTGANDPYKRLKAALKADIDEDAWASLYRTRSRPFDPPSTGRIAVKVINHHGDEVLKSYEVAGLDAVGGATAASLGTT